MKARHQPLSVRKSRNTKQKSSGKTPARPRATTKFSRKDKDIPGDRGPYEKESDVQGSD
jgi:hypothetical protein